MLTTLYQHPPGLIAPYAGATIPSGWLECTGQAVSRSAYANLFAALGGSSSPWGGGDGSTTFNVPDLRGRTPIGVGTGSGLTARSMAGTGGNETHTLTATEMPSHTHTASSTLPYSYTGSGTDSHNWSVSGGGNQQATLGVSLDNTGGGAAHDNMQPWLALTFLIKT